MLEADLCIIGSGAAGVTIAREFAGTTTKVIVLEAGGQSFEQASQDPYRSQVVGLAHGGIHQGRVRQLGGTTNLWAGQALPFLPIDFQKRDWIPHSGWPITRASLEPFYYRAEDVMQIPHVRNDVSGWPSSRHAPSLFAPGTLETWYSQFTTQPNFVKKYGDLIAAAANVRLLTHGNVVSLEAHPSARTLEAVRVRSLDGRAVEVRARYFVVCCGGIESARLLLVSNSVEPQGIGNSHDVVGRYFQDHPGVGVPVQPTPGSAFHPVYDSVRINGFRHSVKIVASPELQRAEQINHIGGEVYYPQDSDDSITAAKDLLHIARTPSQLTALPGALWKVLRRPGRVTAAAWRYYVLKQPASVGSSQPHLGFGGEQEPNPESRVMLADELDTLGQRRSRLDWRMTRNDVRSMEVYLRVVAAEWKRLNLATFDPDSVQIAGRETGAHGGFIDANHHMGTTRMGVDPRTSVVDAQCRVHGYDNLYLGSGSVFPTGSFSNPTLTVIAICLRIADELKLRLI